MVKSKMLLSLICSKLGNNNTNKDLIIYCPKGTTSQIIGHKRQNIDLLKNLYGFKHIKVLENPEFNQNEIKLEIKEENSCV